MRWLRSGLGESEWWEILGLEGSYKEKEHDFEKEYRILICNYFVIWFEKSHNFAKAFEVDISRERTRPFFVPLFHTELKI